MDDPLEPVDDEATLRRTTRMGSLRSLFDRRSTSRPTGSVWSRRISHARSAATILTVFGTALVTVTAAAKRSPVFHDAARVDSTLVALDGRLTANEHRVLLLEMFRDSVAVRRALRDRQLDSIHAEQQFQSYMICSIMRRVDPAGAPKDCPQVSSPRFR